MKKINRQISTQVEIPFEFNLSHLQGLSHVQLIELINKQAIRIAGQRAQLLELDRLVLQMRKALKG